MRAVLDLPDPHTIFAGGWRGMEEFRGEGLNITTPSPFVRFSAWRKGSTRRFKVAAAIAGGCFCAVCFVAASGHPVAGWALTGGLLLAFGAGRSSRPGRADETRKRQAQQPARSEESFKEQKHMLQSILDSLSDGVVAANLQGEFILFNPAAEAIVGLGPGGNGPREWAERYGVFLPDASTPYPPERLPLARAMRGESGDGGIQFLRHSGAPHAVLLRLSASPIPAEAGGV